MPWKDVSLMQLRHEFVTLAAQGDIPLIELCARFGISPKTGRKWRRRFAESGQAGLANRSRRPLTSPAQTPAAMVDQIRIVAVAHPTWGGRMLHHRLTNMGLVAVPAASTITTILQREGLRPPPLVPVRPVIRFDADAPNDRWQMDFKGWKPTPAGPLIPFTVIDDHSRFLLQLEHTGLCTFAVIQALLTELFRRYGLPWQLQSDNGPPWGSSRPHTLTQMDVWLRRLDIRPVHGRPRHPQSQGKIERFHRTLEADLLQHQTFASPASAQVAMDAFRQIYNHERPHSHLGFRPPADCYRLSPRVFPEVLPAIVYDDDVEVRHVSDKGTIRYQGRTIFLSEALQGLPVGLSPTLVDGVIRIQFAARTWKAIDLRTLPVS